MVTIPRFQGLNPRIAPIGGAACALLMVAIIVLMPTSALENLVWTSGVAAIVSAAQPPLGFTARAVLGIAAGGLAGMICWSVLYLLVGPGGFLVGEGVRAADAPPVLRRADAHPDAPARRPISAADLGEPMMVVPRIERDLPKNLEQPLAAFDPAAIPDTPLAAVRPVAPLPRPQPDARIETFALPIIDHRPVAPPPSPKAEPVAPPSIEALLRRLEHGARARVVAH